MELINLANETDIPFKDHPQLALMADTLIRKYQHHIYLQVDLSTCAIKYFIEAFIKYLDSDNVPLSLQQMQCYYLNATNFDTAYLTKANRENNKPALYIISDTEFIDAPANLFHILNDNNCRCLIVTSLTNTINLYPKILNPIIIGQENDMEALHILKSESLALEGFHEVTIPTEIIQSIYTLAKQYISTDHTLQHALLLLDSAAARCKGNELSDNPQITPVLTMINVHKVLVNRTGLSLEHFQSDPTTQIAYLKEHVIGQNAAMDIIHQALEQRSHNQPTYFLFAGDHGIGKKFLALKLAECLYYKSDMVYTFKRCDQLSFTNSIVTSHNQQEMLLGDIVIKRPYAIFIIENIEKFNNIELEQVLNQNLLYQNKILDMSNCIFILTTTLGTRKLKSLTEHIDSGTDEEEDLFKLVLDEEKNKAEPDLSASILIQAILPDLNTHFSKNMLNKIHIVPLLPHNAETREQLVQYYLKEYAYQLKNKYNVELSCAEEVIKFISKDILRNNNDINKALEPVYKLIDYFIKNEVNELAKILHLQLNETGQMLTAQWFSAPKEEKRGRNTG